MSYKFQIIFPSAPDDENKVIERFRSDAEIMQEMGINIGTKPMEDATILMYKGFVILDEEKYPQDPRYLNTFKENINYSFMSVYFPYIADLSIETFFTDELNELVLEEIKKRNWDKAFIKKDTRALENVEEGKSIWPNTSLEEMTKLYEERQITGKYAIRKCIDKEIIDQEERYWVFNGNIYHRHNKIPAVVKEAAKRLDKLGSKYYTIDATPEFVVEVNPGESSDRHAVNSAELFASWIKKEFVDGK
jgi:hypothetical protein